MPQFEAMNEDSNTGKTIKSKNFYSKTNQTHHVSSLLNITLHVSDGLSVHHQESKTVHTALSVCHTGSLTAC